MELRSGEEHQVSTKSLLELRLHDLSYAIGVDFVREIDQVSEITPLPNSLPHICGLMNLRGQVVPVIDLNVRLGLNKTILTRESCVVMVDGMEGIVGLLVDAVTRVLNVPTQALLTAPETCHLQDHTLVTALLKEGPRMITVLDVLHCLDSGPMKKAAGVLTNQAVKLLG